MNKASSELINRISQHEYVDSNFIADNRSVRNAIGDLKDNGVWYIPIGKGIYHKLNKYDMSAVDKKRAKQYYITEMKKSLKALNRIKSFGKDFLDEVDRVESMGELV